MKKDLTIGNVTKTMLLFAGPMILGNLLQQCYNIVDMLIVGRALGAGALAAVGSAYSLMTFLTSVLIGMCMGSGSLFSYSIGKRDTARLQYEMTASFSFIGIVTIVMNIVVFVCMKPILNILQIPEDIYGMMQEYVWYIFWGIFFVFLYNYFSFLLRAAGDSVVSLVFLGISSGLNIVLDLALVYGIRMGIKGAAIATVISQIVSGIGICIYTWMKMPELRFSLRPERIKESQSVMGEVVRYSAASSIQQSVMNFGILMIQGLVNSFGTTIMAAFAAAVKIDTLAYMPAQEYANAYSLFISQNYGARKQERIAKGTRIATAVSVIFCLVVSVIIWIFSRDFMEIFVEASETAIIAAGVKYLRIEGSFYFGIGILFLLYGYYRGVQRAEMSLVLTVISLGTRVALSYMLAPHTALGVNAIWWSIPIGWILADVVGGVYYRKLIN